MGLFDNVRCEIDEMFLEATTIDLTDTRNKILRIAIINDIKNNGEKRASILVKINGLLELKGNGLVLTKHRINSFYKKSGQVITAYGLLQTGLYSGREVAKIVGCSWFPITKLLKIHGELKCICGVPLREHKGWCNYRLSKSEKRKAFIEKWGNKKFTNMQAAPVSAVEARAK